MTSNGATTRLISCARLMELGYAPCPAPGHAPAHGLIGAPAGTDGAATPHFLLARTTCAGHAPGATCVAARRVPARPGNRGIRAVRGGRGRPRTSAGRTPRSRPAPG